MRYDRLRSGSGLDEVCNSWGSRATADNKVMAAGVVECWLWPVPSHACSGMKNFSAKCNHAFGIFFTSALIHPGLCTVKVKRFVWRSVTRVRADVGRINAKTQKFSLIGSLIEYWRILEPVDGFIWNTYDYIAFLVTIQSKNISHSPSRMWLNYFQFTDSNNSPEVHAPIHRKSFWKS